MCSDDVQANILGNRQTDRLTDVLINRPTGKREVMSVTYLCQKNESTERVRRRAMTALPTPNSAVLQKGTSLHTSICRVMGASRMRRSQRNIIIKEAITSRAFKPLSRSQRE